MTFKKPIRAANYLKLKRSNDKEVEENESNNHKNFSEFFMTKKIFDSYFSGCGDIELQDIPLNRGSGLTVYLAFTIGLADTDLINEFIVKPILIGTENLKEINGNLINHIKDNVLTVAVVETITDLAQFQTKLLSGDTILFIEGENTVLSILSRKKEARGVEEPETEAVIRGSREGFNESLFVNISLIRRRLKTNALKFELIKLGQKSHTDIAVCYIEGIIHQEILEQLRQRLNNIKIDAILESGYIEEFIEDAPFSMFPTVGNTEKPDTVAAKLLEGHAAIIIDGTPFVLTVPYLFIESLQSSEDYYSRYFYSSMIRSLRFLALFISISLPGFYVAFSSFHPDVIPLKLLLSMVTSREGIPFSPFTEALILGISFEILREAGVRMPRPIGQAVSIVGALVMGEALIRAGLASAPIVIVTAITAITNFIIPPMNGTIPIIRLATLFSANILGFTGMFLLWVTFLLHLCSLKSFGIPYMIPFAPLNGADLQDSFLRIPLWAMVRRPKSLTWGRGTTNTKYRAHKEN